MKFLDKIKNARLKDQSGSENPSKEESSNVPASSLQLDVDIDIDTSTKPDEKPHYDKKKWLKILSYVLLFLISFSIFLYISFPYSILKETIIQKTEQASGMTVDIEDVSFSLPLGLKLKNMTLSTKSSSYTLKKVAVNLAFFPLLFAQANITVKVNDSQGGVINIKVGAGIFNLVFSKNKLPSYVGVLAKKFSITELSSLIIPNASSNPMIAPLLDQIVITGYLDTDIKLKLNDDPKKTDIQIILKLSDSSINVKSEDLNLPSQKFEKSLIKAGTSGGIFKIDNTSGFESQDLSVGFDGTVTFADKLMQSEINVSIPVKLKGELLTQYGFLLGGGRGYATYILSGTLGRMSTIQK